MIRNRIDFKLLHGTLWGYPTKTLLVSVIKEIQRDNSVSLMFPDQAITILQNHFNAVKEGEVVRFGYMNTDVHTVHETLLADEQALILDIAQFLKTTSFVVSNEIDQF